MQALRVAMLGLGLSTACLCGSFMTGCGMGTAADGPVKGAQVGGRVIGGQQPVSASTIQMYTPGTTYGGASATLGASTTTDANGNFTIVGPYICPSPTTPVYIAATQGNPGVGGGVTNNTSIAMIAALGPCGNLNAGTHIIINEITTVGAVYALSQFMTAVDHVGTSTTNATGLANAFSTAGVLTNYVGGSVTGGSAPAGSIIPSAEISTLANVLAACINSAGGTAGDSSSCGKLYTYATVGTTAPTNTVSALLNIALHPGTNVSSIYGLVNATGPFQPSLSAAPNDWTVAVSYPLGGTSATLSDIQLAIDAGGNAWVQTGTALYELNPTGSLLGSYPSLAGNTVALDASGNIWGSTVSTTDKLWKMPSTLGTPAFYTSNLSPYEIVSISIDAGGNAYFAADHAPIAKVAPTGTVSYATLDISRNVAVAALPAGPIWYASLYGKIYSETSSLTNSNTYPCTTSSCSAIALAADGSGNAWLSSYGVTKVTATGTETSYGGQSNGFTGGIYSPQGLFVDGAGSIWIANNIALSNATNGALSGLTGSGVAITPPTGFVSSTLNSPFSIAGDLSGNVWLENTNSVTVFVGVAVPTITPLALALTNGTIGTKP